MPELPEVEAICRNLAPRLAGRRIKTIDVLLPRIIRSGDANSLLERKIEGVSRRGKHILVKTDRDPMLYVHLRMSGTLLWREEPGPLDKFIRAVIATDNGYLLYRDVRTLGGLWIASENSPPWKSLGPDPFDDAFSSVYLNKILKNRHIAIKVALLDQAIVAGIGNIYASELLFRAGIDPRSISASLIYA